MEAPFESHIEFERMKRPRRAASIIPLVDIAFFLLIFFMVAGTIEQFEIIDIAPPEAKSGEMVDEGHITILVGKHDEIVMDDLLLTPDEMGQRLQTTLQAHPDKVITLKADALVPAVQLIAIMDRVQMAGGKQVTIATNGSEKD